MKQLTIKLDEVNALLIRNTLEYYNLYILEEAERKDPTKDNGYLINAIKEFLRAYDEATKESK